MGPVAQSEADQDVPSTSSSRPNRKSYTTSVDKSSSRRGFLQHLAVWIWIGWIFFYMIFFATLPFLYLYFPTALTIIVSLMTFSAFMPIDKKYQPSVITPRNIVFHIATNHIFSRPSYIIGRFDFWFFFSSSTISSRYNFHSFIDLTRL